MTDDQPIEPSAILAPDGTYIPYRSRRPRAAAPDSRNLLPDLFRAASAGPVLAASALALTAITAARAAEVFGRMAWQMTVGVVGGDQLRRDPSRGVEVTWTHVEIRWPF